MSGPAGGIHSPSDDPAAEKLPYPTPPANHIDTALHLLAVVDDVATGDGSTVAIRGVLIQKCDDRGLTETARELDAAHSRNGDLVEALRLTVEYVGLDVLPPREGWSWFDALSKHAPSRAAQLAAKAQPPAFRSPILKWFRSDHMPYHAGKPIAQHLEALAFHLDRTLDPSAELSAGLRKLLEAKDCLVRAALETRSKENNS